MSKHREAYEAFLNIVKYSERKCKDCIFNISKSNDVCVWGGCPMFNTDVIINDVQKRVEELERQEKQ